MAGLNSLMSLLMRFKSLTLADFSEKSWGNNRTSWSCPERTQTPSCPCAPPRPPTPEKNVANLPLMASYFNLCSTNFMKIVSILEIEVTIYTVHLKILFFPLRDSALRVKTDLGQKILYLYMFLFRFSFLVSMQLTYQSCLKTHFWRQCLRGGKKD